MRVPAPKDMQHPSNNRRDAGASPFQPPSIAARRGWSWPGICLLVGLLAPGCSGGGGGLPDSNPNDPPGSTGDFAVLDMNVLDGITWQLNRPIEIGFNQDVDISTVSSSTVQIVDSQGVPAVGAYSMADPRTVRFQPTCPTNDGNSDGGLLQGREYRIIVRSETEAGIAGGVTVQNTAGERLETGSSRSFRTPESLDELILFVDEVPGPPRVRVRGQGDEPLNATDTSYVEFPGRGAPLDRQYLTFDPATQQGRIDGSVPLNLYSDPSQTFALVLRFNQSVIASSSNVTSQRLGLEFLDSSSGEWERVPSEVELLENCTDEGALVRLVPTGIVPQGAQLRAIVRTGFSDLTGDPVPASLTNFALMESELANPTGANPDDGNDGFLIDFTPGAESASVFREDTETATLNPRANWSEDSAPGVLEASFDFAGTGGPDGNFDWVVRANQVAIISTDADSIAGGPGGFPTNQQPVIGGIINVRNFIVEQGARVSFVGSNTVTLLATGTVDISGTVSVDGADNPGVGTLNTTNSPELGAKGNAGGGDGGIGSFETSRSTRRGGTGFGAFNLSDGGGQGGETGFSALGKEFRRGAGGGGGRFGQNVRYEVAGGFVHCQSLVGFDAERGISGSLDGTGGQNLVGPSQGGAPGPRPFLDSDDDNDFFGVLVAADGRQIRGELTRTWAGAGGGAGGDASSVSTFPMTPFSAIGDEKGCGGGGGAGGIEILAVGDVIIRDGGSISADGGTGNGGENTWFFDRVGGGSGGGSGGHIVVSSAARIIIESEATASTVNDFYLDTPSSQIHEKRPITALGGQGGAGRQSGCGANEDGEGRWIRDSIPTENFEGNTSVPPQGQSVWEDNCNNTEDGLTPFPLGETPGAGGDGGPGIIQLHVADPATQLLFPNRAGVYGDLANPLDPTRSCSPPPFGWTRPSEPVDVFLPFFSARSESYSDWIPLGLARKNPGGAADDQLMLQFGGTDPATGEVLRSGQEAQELAPLIAYTALSQGGAALPSIDALGATLSVSGAALPALYRENPLLLAQFAVRIRDEAAPATETEYLVQSAQYDEDEDIVALVVDPQGTTLVDQIVASGVYEVELVPFFVRLSSGGVQDAYPSGTEVRILFDAARANPTTGGPSTDPALIFSGGDLSSFTADIGDLNNDVWDFVRLKFEFEIDIDERDAPRPGIDWVRLLYSF